MNLVEQIDAYFDDKYRKCGSPWQRFDVERARAMVHAYRLHWANDGFRVRAIEEAFDLPIFDPATKAPLLVGDVEPRYAGVIDAILEDPQGKLWLCDHKTCSASSTGTVYLEGLKTDAQLSHYLLAMKQMGIEVQGFVWDMIVKLGIRPKAVTKAAKAEIATGYYCGLPFNGDYNDQKKETAKLFGVRCLATLLDDTDKYFIRVPVRRSPQQLLDYCNDLAQVAEDMILARDNPRRQYRSRGACKNYNQLCEFHGLCSDDFTVDGSAYRERSPVDDSQRRTPKGSLSTSRISTFQTCRKKWALRYVDKVEKSHQEYSDALAIGTMLHEGLEMVLEPKKQGDPITLMKDENE